MTVTSISRPTAVALTDAQKAGFRDYHLCQIEAGDTLRRAFHHAREARQYGADPAEVLMRPDAWVAERGLA